ncbi:glutaredoxin family protein [Corynebacterium alimapuense]|uniref:Thioredoxin family protein n=1 Tax=Corynebacterium alimapuense TaxID=1576874 RepID=A0A3M8K927_9CORY|nr:glutaredoxin family protein [Corynebacterium alimapuense]RNE48958.1 thioredoxin family protein [Corynebacterium alimapuense]
MSHTVELMVRASCGSCARVAAQIAPVVESAGAVLEILDVDEDRGLAVEFGDRVPVVVIDGEEFACWEVDDAELAQALVGEPPHTVPDPRRV